MTMMIAINANAMDYYGIVNYISGDAPEIHYSDTESGSLKLNDRLKSGCTILTGEHQAVEITIYNDNKASGYIVMSENTDIEINFGETIDLSMNYGRIRTVSNVGNPIALRSKAAGIRLNGGDLGFDSLIDDENNVKGAVLDFGGTFDVASSISSQSGTLNPMGRCDLLNGDLIFSAGFSKDDLNFWQGSMALKSDNIPDNVNFFLEKIKLDAADQKTQNVNTIKKETPVVKESETTAKNSTDDVKKETEVKQDSENVPVVENSDVTGDKAEKKTGVFDRDKFLCEFLSFKFAGTGYDEMIENFKLQNLGVIFAFDPSIVLFDGKFEFGFYLDLAFFPYTVCVTTTPGWEMFGQVNSNSRFADHEWSFGSDQNSEAGRIVFDVFDDLLLKMKTIRYNDPDDKIYVKAGQFNGIDETLKFSLDNFNPVYFSRLQRNESFFTKFDFGWFKANIYAEDVMPKGLYGTNFTLSTPGKSFVFKYYFSTYMDCYDTVQFSDNAVWMMPARFDSSLILDTFNLPSFGLTFFLNGGVFIPFSSLLNDRNSMLVSSGLIFSFGFNIRGNVKNNEFNFSLEFVKDGYLDKIGMFDLSYKMNRESYVSRMLSYYDGLSGRVTNDYFSDHYFGFRSRFNYNFLKHVNVDLSYQWGISMGLTSYNVSGLGAIPVPDTANIRYYDKINFKLTLDSLDKWKIPCDLYLLWAFDGVINAIGNTVVSSNAYSFFSSNSIFLGSNIHFIKGLSLFIQGGMYPFAGLPNFCFEAGLNFKPYYFKKK
jgi:hypothetical protein